MTTTQNCADCGTRAEPGQSFCDACGAVLSWTDRPGGRSPSGADGRSAGSTGGSARGTGDFDRATGEPAGAMGASGGTTDGFSGAGDSSAQGADGYGRTPGESGTAMGSSNGNRDDYGAADDGTARGAGGYRDTAHASGGTTGNSARNTDDFGGATGESRAAMSGSGGNTGGSPQGAGGYGGASDGGPGDPSFATSPAGSAASAGSSAPVPAAQASGPGAGPGWDAFARADGGAGLARTPRDLLSAGTTTTEPGASADQAAASHQDSQPSASRTPGGTGAADRSGSAPSPTAASHPVTPPVDDTAPTEPVPASTASADADADADAEGMTDRARRLLVPVADPEPRPTTTPSVAPVLPGRPAAQRPQAVRAPGEELGADGGTPCPWCATRNRPDRHFCTRCAMPMAGEAQAPARLPWWRRLVGLGNRETPWAGDRPRLRRTFDRILTWLGAAIVLTVLIMLAFNIPKAVQATRDHFSKRASVAPDSYSASRSYQGHPPRLLFDKYRNTWWGPGVADSGKGQWVEARFDEPTRLLDLIITPGVSTQAAQLSQSALPHRVKATITLANGKTTTRELVLDQSAGGQRVSFRVGEVTAVRFTIESSYQTSGSKQVAIAEIEFFGPSHAS